MRQYIRLHIGAKASPITIAVDDFGAVAVQNGAGPASSTVYLKSGVGFTVVEEPDDVIKLLRHAELIEQNNQSNVSYINGTIKDVLVQ